MPHSSFSGCSHSAPICPLRRALASCDPNHSELCSLLVVLNLNLVSNLQLAPGPAQPHPMFADIQRAREMALFASSDHSRVGTTALVLIDRRLPV
jgi:hypothetical protein